MVKIYLAMYSSSETACSVPYLCFVSPMVVCLFVQQKDVEAGEGALCSKANDGFKVF